jgi:hypothetical protein
VLEVHEAKYEYLVYHQRSGLAKWALVEKPPRRSPPVEFLEKIFFQKSFLILRGSPSLSLIPIFPSRAANGTISNGSSVLEA